jgi:hypothetical protein
MINVWIKKLLGEANVGRLNYYLKPELKKSLGGPFNGQAYRMRIFQELLRSVAFDAIVETGAYLGTTTEYFATTGLPVYTVEINPRFWGYTAARIRSKHLPVRLHLDNSPNFLRALANNPTFSPAKPFFYLDAHWYDHLPLAEELEIIFKRWNDAVVMVDDFQVPGSDYTYDDYGPGKALTLDYLKPLHRLSLAFFFPSGGAELETGRKRGSVTLCQNEGLIKALESISVLKRWRD